MHHTAIGSFAPDHFFTPSSMRFLIQLIVSTLAVMIAAYIVPGVVVDSYFTALVVAVMLGLVNSLIRPILLILTLPITLLTMGLFALVINTLMVILVDLLVPGFEVNGFLTALLFSILLSLINWFLHPLKK